MRATRAGTLARGLRKPFIALLAAVALLGAACDDDPDVVVVEEDDEVDEIEEVPEDCLDLTATDGSPAPVTMMDTFFEPDCFSLSSTQGITLTNAGDALHNFSIEGTDVDIDVGPGADLTTEPIGDVVEFGTFDFFCKYHRDGVLTVE